MKDISLTEWKQHVHVCKEIFRTSIFAELSQFQSLNAKFSTLEARPPHPTRRIRTCSTNSANNSISRTKQSSHVWPATRSFTWTRRRKVQSSTCSFELGRIKEMSRHWTRPRARLRKLNCIGTIGGFQRGKRSTMEERFTANKRVVHTGRKARTMNVGSAG